jgi:hypothetical protein
VRGREAERETGSSVVRVMPVGAKRLRRNRRERGTCERVARGGATRWPSAGRGRGGRSRRASCKGHAGHAAMATRLWRHAHVRPGAAPALALGRPWPGRALLSGELHGACRSCRDRDAPMAAHTCAARRWPSAGRGQEGRPRRASCKGRAGLAAIATRQWRHAHVRPGAGSRPAVAGEGGRVARAARGVQVTP